MESIDPGVGAMEKDELRDPVDEANSNIQASHELRMKNRELFYYKKLNQTLDRIKKGTVGICKECDGEINFERIMARPTAEMCISCKEESEMAEQNNFFHRKSKSLGKTLVVTRGEKGAMATDGREVVECGIQQGLKIIDLTGAGDLFAAGFLHGNVNNMSLKESLEKGTEMSSKVIQQIGARL